MVFDTILFMRLPDKAIKEFIEIFEKEFGKKLNWKEGRESAQNLFDYMSLLLEMDKKKDGDTRKS